MSHPRTTHPTTRQQMPRLSPATAKDLTSLQPVPVARGKKIAVNITQLYERYAEALWLEEYKNRAANTQEPAACHLAAS